jgi:lipopolysaccharide/colanic/teichoic acid biosynthesis glycosyltransferase/glycosyltransferase involved in cell wall biosynthesis
MKPKACIVVASEMTVRAFLGPQLRAMQDRYDVTVAVNSRASGLLHEMGVTGTVVPMPIGRPISIVADAWALCSLVRLMRRQRFDLVHSMTPKAGLLAMGAAWLSRIPVRLHTFTGQVWATRKGFSRAILKMADRAIARCATYTLADSASQREFLIREQIVAPDRIAVLGSGSVSGVDATRFRPDGSRRRQVREQFQIPDAGVVLLFVGRLSRDKGVLDLAKAFAAVAAEFPVLHVLVVGPDEEGLRPAVARVCATYCKRLHFIDYTTAPEDVMAASDILCLPSYREGFGSVVIEAAAAGLPAVASRIYGLVDAVVDGQTGLLHEPGDVADLAACLRQVVGNAGLRCALGSAARDRALRDFQPSVLTSSLLDLYAGHSADRAAAREGGWYRRVGKRTFDIVGSAAAILVLLPLAAVIALVVRAFLGAPILFRQSRPGLHGVPFRLIKFRTMSDRRNDAGSLLPDADRLGRLGRFLRGASLDELPELLNVLAGEMSLVGPRPLLMAYLDLYTPRQARRHLVRPGITGLAQVSGRNGLSWEEKFELDIEYVDRCSFALDVKILARTVRQVLLRRDINQPGHATAEEFGGPKGPHYGTGTVTR